MKLYTADRSSRLSAGLPILPTTTATTGLSNLDRHMQQLYPKGLSEHGLQYVTDIYLNRPNSNNWMIEVVAELVRREIAPDAPSRFDCMFGSSTLANAVDFGERYTNRGQSFSVWEFDAAISFEADMTHLTGRSFIECHYNCEKYWRQERSNTPTLEYLVPLPVIIGTKVGDGVGRYL